MGLEAGAHLYATNHQREKDARSLGNAIRSNAVAAEIGPRSCNTVLKVVVMRGGAADTTRLGVRGQK